jgi:putative endonuclease
MKYVYLIRSIKSPEQTYVGLTTDVQKRLAAHDAGQSPHTSKYAPWKLVAFLGFEDETKAAEFERYLKSGSGRAFAAKRFW